jgi:flagellar biogenesis protein FliO
VKRIAFAALALSMWTGPTLAQETEPTVIDEQFIGPLPPPAEAVDAELDAAHESLTDEELLAPPPSASRGWLKEEAATPAQRSSGNSGLTVVALLLVLGLAGGAVFMKQRRGQQKEVRVASSLRVLSQVRVGPKANLVTVAVSGRVMLLGVTETNVTNLGLLGDGMPEDDLDAADAATDNVLALPHGAVSKKRFEQELENSLARAPSWSANPQVASLLVDRSEDAVVRTSSTRATGNNPAVAGETRAARVEDQVLGLLRRRKS